MLPKNEHILKLSNSFYRLEVKNKIDFSLIITKEIKVKKSMLIYSKVIFLNLVSSRDYKSIQLQAILVKASYSLALNQKIKSFGKHSTCGQELENNYSLITSNKFVWLT